MGGRGSSVSHRALPPIATHHMGHHVNKVTTGKLAVVPPAGTTTTGLEAASAVFELASVTTVPPAGAAPPSVTVPVAPPPIVDGLSVSEATPGPTTAQALPPLHQSTSRKATTENTPCRMVPSPKPISSPE